MLESLITQYGYYAVLVGCLLEGEAVLALAGYAAHRGYLQWHWVWAVGALGGFLGDQIYFQLGRRYGRAMLGRFPAAAAHRPRLERIVARSPALAVTGLRFLYGLRTVGPIAIGAGRMPPAQFAFYNAIGAMIWAAVIAGLGYLLGHTLELILDDVKRIEQWVIGGLLVAAMVLWLLRRRRGGD